MTLETKRLVTGDDTGDLAAGEWTRHWKLRGWGVETTLENLAAKGWRRHWRLSGWRLETTLETGEWRGHWRLSCWGVKTTQEI